MNTRVTMQVTLIAHMVRKYFIENNVARKLELLVGTKEDNND